MKKSLLKGLSPLKKAVIITLIVIASIVLLLTGIRAGEQLAFISFYSRARAEFNMPGTATGYVGQGLDYVEEENVFLTCGYSAKKGEPSMVYRINGKGKATCIRLYKENGKPYTGHTGGIAHYNNYVYITGADGCDVFNLSDFVSGDGTAKKIGEIKSPAGHDPAYVSVHNGKLYEGSFFRSGNYETPDFERITTPSGDENKSLIFVYNLNSGKQFGVDQSPVAAYSIRGLVQGMTFTEKEIVLSTSWGISTSHLYFYDNSAISSGQLNLGDSQIPLYYLDSAACVRDVKAPPMAEEIVYKDGKIYIMTESASNKYIFGKFMGGLSVFAYKI